MTTGAQGHNYNRDAGGHRGIYKWRRGHRECSISNHHQQSSRAIIRIMRYRSEYGLFFPWTTGTQLTTGTLREKLSDTRDTGNINDDRDTGTQLQRGRRGYRGIYKWRRGYRECSISNHHQQSSRAIIRIMKYRSEYGCFYPWTNDDQDTGTQGHNYNGDARGHGGYINDDRDTGNVRLAITISKAQGQSLE